MANPNLGLLISLAQAMGPLCEQVVFVGGCAMGLLVDDADLMDLVQGSARVCAMVKLQQRLGRPMAARRDATGRARAR